MINLIDLDHLGQAVERSGNASSTLQNPGKAITNIITFNLNSF